MLVMLTMMWLVQLPLAFILSRYTALGAFGVRWAVAASFIAAAIAYLIYFRAGRWQRKRL
jgi:Na+-driven multidrug efflux pump